jgi:hypothetical protein
MKHRGTGCIVQRACALGSLCCAAPAAAQEVTRSLTMGGDAIALPGIGRVLLAFLVVAGLAVGVSVLLRRFAPKLTGGSLLPNGGSLRVLERLHLGGDLRVHLIQTEQGRVLITTHRNSIAVVKLDPPAQDAQQP